MHTLMYKGEGSHEAPVHTYTVVSVCSAYLNVQGGGFTHTQLYVVHTLMYKGEGSHIHSCM